MEKAMSQSSKPIEICCDRLIVSAQTSLTTKDLLFALEVMDNLRRNSRQSHRSIAGKERAQTRNRAPWSNWRSEAGLDLMADIVVLPWNRAAILYENKVSVRRACVMQKREIETIWDMMRVMKSYRQRKQGVKHVHWGTNRFHEPRTQYQYWHKGKPQAFDNATLEAVCLRRMIALEAKLGDEEMFQRRLTRATARSADDKEFRKESFELEQLMMRPYTIMHYLERALWETHRKEANVLFKDRSKMCEFDPEQEGDLVIKEVKVWTKTRSTHAVIRWKKSSKSRSPSPNPSKHSDAHSKFCTGRIVRAMSEGPAVGRFEKIAGFGFPLQKVFARDSSTASMPASPSRSPAPQQPRPSTVGKPLERCPPKSSLRKLAPKPPPRFAASSKIDASVIGSPLIRCQAREPLPPSPLSTPEPKTERTARKRKRPREMWDKVRAHFRKRRSNGKEMGS